MAEASRCHLSTAEALMVPQEKWEKYDPLARLYPALDLYLGFMYNSHKVAFIVAELLKQHQDAGALIYSYTVPFIGRFKVNSLSVSLVTQTALFFKDAARVGVFFVTAFDVLIICLNY